MGTVNYGAQKVTFAYKNAATGEDFNHLLRGGIKPGFYEGFSGITRASATSVTIPTYNLYIKSGTDKLVHVVASSSYTKTVAPVHTQEYLYGTYTWSDSTTNYLDFYTRSASGVAVDNEIIFGTIVSSGGSVLAVNQSGVTCGLYDENYNFNKIIISDTTNSTTKYTGSITTKGGIASEKHITAGLGRRVSLFNHNSPFGGELFSTFAEYVPNINDQIIASGGIRNIPQDLIIVSSIKRTSDTEITFYGITNSGVASSLVNSLYGTYTLAFSISI